jgi:hypothetical protein
VEQHGLPPHGVKRAADGDCHFAGRPRQVGKIAIVEAARGVMQ